MSGSKFIQSTILSLSLLGTGSGARAAGPPPEAQSAYVDMTATAAAGADADRQGDDAPKPPANPGLLTELQRAEVRDKLLDSARTEFIRIAKEADNKYSKDLHHRSDHLTSRLQRHENSKISGVVYIDPNEFVTGLALGGSPMDTAQELLKARNVSLPDNIVRELAEGMATEIPDIYTRGKTSTQNPEAYRDSYSLDPQVCVVVPVSAYYTPEFQVPGFTYQQNVDYINRHEGWHCLDTHFNTVGIDKKEIDKLDPDHLDAAYGNKDQMKFLSIQNKKESLGDVGAAGDMIRNGENPSIISNVIAFRTQDGSDTLHMTVSSLTALRDKINEMGLDRFRRLDDREARALYESVVEKNAMTPEMVPVVAALWQDDDETRDAIRNGPVTLRAVDAAMTLGAQVRDGADPKVIDDALRDLPPGEEATAKALGVLRDEIAEIGVDRFRKLDEADAGKLQQDLFVKTDFDDDMASGAVKYIAGTEDDRRAVRKDLDTLQEAVQKSLTFAAPYAPPMTDAEKEAEKQKAEANGSKQEIRPLSPEEQKVFSELSKYDAVKMLQDRAFKDEGRITPSTLAHAYGKLQDDLRHKLEKEPASPLLHAEASKLQESFIYVVKELDYVQANADRGVDIMKKEPALRGFTPAPDPGPLPLVDAAPDAPADGGAPPSAPDKPRGTSLKAPRPSPGA